MDAVVNDKSDFDGGIRSLKKSEDSATRGYKVGWLIPVACTTVPL